MTYDEFFRQATKSPSEPQGRELYPHQWAFALDDELQDLLNVPTGVGKAVVIGLAWIWERLNSTWKLDKTVK